MMNLAMCWYKNSVKHSWYQENGMNHWIPMTTAWNVAQPRTALVSHFAELGVILASTNSSSFALVPALTTFEVIRAGTNSWRVDFNLLWKTNSNLFVVGGLESSRRLWKTWLNGKSHIKWFLIVYDSNCIQSAIDNCQSKERISENKREVKY